MSVCCCHWDKMSGKIQDFYIFYCFILSFIVLRPPSSHSKTHLIVISELFSFSFFPPNLWYGEADVKSFALGDQQRTVWRKFSPFHTPVCEVGEPSGLLPHNPLGSGCVSDGDITVYDQSAATAYGLLLQLLEGRNGWNNIIITAAEDLFFKFPVFNCLFENC